MELDKSVETSTENEEYEALLPEGWKDGDDFFDPASWGANDTADAQGNDGAPGDSTREPSFDELFRTLGQSNEAQEESTEPETEAGDTTPAAATDGKLRFKATFDHSPIDVELDPTDLPTIWQKAQALDRAQSRAKGFEDELAAWDGVAKHLGYDSREALRSGVIENSIQEYMNENPGVPEDMARDWITRKFGDSPTAAKQTASATDNTPASEGEPANTGRNFQNEVNELFTTFPEARRESIPDEVVMAAVGMNKPLVQAYSEYKAEKAEAAARAAREENKILKQNQASAARAPVSPVTRGGKTDTKPSDPFLAGFYADEY